MIPRIKSVKPMKDYVLNVIFDNGKNVLYDMNEDIDTLVELQNKMLKEKSIKAITNVYVDYAINSIVTGSDIKIQDTSKLVQNMAKESIILI